MSGPLDWLLDRSIFFSFDRSGFLRHRESFRPEDLDVDLDGKVCLVTGANSGLGLATAHALAQLGAEVRLLCRSEKRGRTAERDVRFASGNDRVFLELIDLANLRSIHEFLARWGDRPVDVLIHNAGVLPLERIETEDGLELAWQVNVVAPFLLTWKLAPDLRAASDGARVIFVTSGGMYTQRLDLRDVAWREREYDGVKAYAQTKRAEVVLTELWAERLAGSGIVVNAMHPGWAATPGVEGSLPRFWKLMESRLRSPREGADTIVWLAACERIAGETGKLWFDRRAVDTHFLSRTRERPGDRRALWALCRRQAGLEDEDLGER